MYQIEDDDTYTLNHVKYNENRLEIYREKLAKNISTFEVHRNHIWIWQPQEAVKEADKEDQY